MIRRTIANAVAGAVSCAALLGSTACSDGTGPSPVQADSLAALPRTLTATERQGITSGNAFALSLLRESMARATTPNVLLSPLSVSYALGMTMNGAGGATLAEMSQTLGWGSRARAEINPAYKDLMALLPTLDPTVTIRIANGIWTREPLQADPGFAADVRTYFGAEARSAKDEQAMFDAVNAWGNTQTNGMIPKVLDTPPPRDLVMLLANAVYFSGTWRDRFDAAETKPGPFRLESGASVQVPLMHRKGKFSAMQNAGMTAVELSYGNSAYSMLFIVPSNEPIGTFVARFDSTMLAGITDGLQPMNDNIELYLPKFTLREKVELRPHLSEMGMPTAFTNGAEFPRLLGFGTKLDFVRHAVAIEVDEEGTRAAGVTVVGVVPVSLPPQMRVDRPFVFMIRERFAGTILFTGVVRDPRG
ncbi:MAG: serpin family protein [Gemmatimonadota bacterium]